MGLFRKLKRNSSGKPDEPKPAAAPKSPKIILEHPLLGQVAVVNSRKAKRLSLSVKATGEVRLTIPRGIGQAEAMRFLEEKKEWVISAKKRVTKRTAVQIIGMPYSTRRHTLSLAPAPTNQIQASVKNGIIRVSYPAQLSYEDPLVQEVIKKGIEEAWRIEAKEYLPKRTLQLASELGFKCGTITVRNARTRWGSCSPSNNISLSIQMMKLPDRLIDYIIIHELCHTVHKNHGPKFHALLDKKTNGAHQDLRRQLKNHSTFLLIEK